MKSLGYSLAWLLLPTFVSVCLREVRAEEQNGMVLVSARRLVVGTSAAQRDELAGRFDCHPSWLGDDLERHEANVGAFWIDRFPMTNTQYLAFVEATGHARPQWWNRWGSKFPSEYAEHPVVGLSAKDAMAYVKWAGKRLPSGEEWEAAVAGPNEALYAWGDAWPGPVKLEEIEQVSWDLPATHAVGGGDRGRSDAGVEDFAGQVLEWVSDLKTHNVSKFRLLKGASWFHQDPLNFRIASGCYANETWQSAFSGLRCALDGNETPPRTPKAQAKKSTSVFTTPAEPNFPDTSAKPWIEVRSNLTKSIVLHVPRFGQEIVTLMAPETILFDRGSVMTYRDHPDMTWSERSKQRAAYEMRFPKLRLNAEFVANDDSFEQRFTVTNLTDIRGELNTSSCFKLQGLPMFYDCEQLRTFALGEDGEFVRSRQLARGTDRVHWINRLSGDGLGRNPRWAVMAVVSRDGGRVIAAGRADHATGFSLATNTLFTCLHCDSTVPIEADHSTTTREILWFLDGTLDDLRARIKNDLKLPD